MIPAVLYGGNMPSSIPLLVHERDLMRTWRTAGASSLVTLSLNQGEAYNVLIHDMQYHPVTDAVLHADFYAVRMDEKIRTTVQIVCTGEAPGVKYGGGNLVRVMQEVDIECLPQDLPRELTVDVSLLAKVHDALRIKDLALPAGVSVKAEAEDIVVLVAEAGKVEEAAEVSVDEQAAISAIKTEGEEKREKKASEKEEKKET